MSGAGPRSRPHLAPCHYQAGDASLGYAVSNSTAYLNLHVKLTAELGKPLVLTAFSLARDTSHGGHAPQV